MQNVWHRTMHSSFPGQHGQWHGSLARAPNDDDDDVARHGGRLGSHTLSIPCQPYQFISLILDIHVMVN